MRSVVIGGGGLIGAHLSEALQWNAMKLPYLTGKKLRTWMGCGKRAQFYLLEIFSTLRIFSDSMDLLVIKSK